MYATSDTRSSMILSVLAILLIGGLIGRGVAHMPSVHMTERI